MILDRILEEYPDEEFLVANGLNDAIVGVSTDNRLVYSVDKIIEILTLEQGMTYEESMEYFCFNIQDAYMGEKTPIFINLIQ